MIENRQFGAGLWLIQQFIDRFEPSRPEERRDELDSRWKRAVAKAIDESETQGVLAGQGSR